jgi:hypothetical protein
MRGSVCRLLEWQKEAGRGRGGELERTSAQHDDVVFLCDLIHNGGSLVLVFDVFFNVG